MRKKRYYWGWITKCGGNLKRKRLRVSGFLIRKSSSAGYRILRARRRKGRTNVSLKK